MKRTNLDAWICETEGLPELSREALENLQLCRLNETLKRLQERNGHYKHLPDRLETLDQLQELPFTTPDMLAHSPGSFLLTSQSEVKRVITGSTSGTTGPSKRVFYTDRDTEHTVGFFGAGISEMAAPGEKVFIAMPFSGAHGLGDLIAKAVERFGGVPICAGFGQSYQELVHLMKIHRPETYIGFPVPLLGLARFFGNEFPVKRALVSGDACPAGVMNALEQLLGSKLYPHYGLRETALGGAVTCPAFEGMHLRENHIIAEIVNEDGHRLPHGQYGELVLTTIGLEAMPLIRYRTGDFTRIYPKPCPCGGVTLRIGQVSRKDPHALSMEDLDSALFSIPELIDYRATLQTETELCIEAKTLRDGMEEQLVEHAQSVFHNGNVLAVTSLCTGNDRPLYLGKRTVQNPV